MTPMAHSAQARQALSSLSGFPEWLPAGRVVEQQFIDILRRAAHENDKCVIVVTHSKQLAKEADVVLKLKDKKLKR